jgi:hypothetical protein
VTLNTIRHQQRHVTTMTEPPLPISCCTSERSGITWGTACFTRLDWTFGPHASGIQRTNLRPYSQNLVNLQDAAATAGA